MKAIIGGKKYDTDNSDLLGAYESGHGRGDFEWVREELYRTQRGAYFLSGEGGAKTRYATPGRSGRSKARSASASTAESAAEPARWTCVKRWVMGSGVASGSPSITP